LAYVNDWKAVGQDMTNSVIGVKLFADGADKQGMLEMYGHQHVSGFTTNPTLMRKAGVVDYLAFARDIVEIISDKPISFEVFSDDLDAMEREAHILASLGENVYVKIPITTTKGEFCGPIIRRLARDDVKVNVTALMTVAQVKDVASCLGDSPSYVSVFAGRIADTGRDPVPLMVGALEVLRPLQNAELIWASPRELLNVVQAAEIGCHVITATNDIIKKLPLLGKDLQEFSLETVQMFHHDARAAGYGLVEPRLKKTSLTT
jgi:transaldolase